MESGLNLAGKTYEVYIREKGRWLLDSEHATRSAAMSMAAELLEGARGEGVRVVSESTRTGDEEVLLEEVRAVADKGLTIVPVEESPTCDTLDELLDPEARQTAGRLLRKYLADQGITALELAFDYGRLRLLERMDKLYAPAMQRIGGLQARTTGDKPHARVEVLYRLFAELKKLAQTSAETASADAAVIGEHGFDALAGKLEAQGLDTTQRRRRLLAALAGAMRTAPSLTGRIDVLVAALAGTTDAERRDLIDGVLAEVLDRPDAIAELLAAPNEPAKTAQALAELVGGQCAYRPSSETLVELDKAFQGEGLAASRRVLLARVALIVRSTKPLTRSGEEADRSAFEALLGDLTRPGGLAGGPDMAVAVLNRVRHLYRPTPDADDLDFKEALQRLLSYLPAHAVRLGLLLDLLAAPEIEKRQNHAVVQTLGRLVQRLDGPGDLVPPGARQDAIAAAIDDLRRRLEAENIPESWRAMFAETLDRLARAQAAGAAAATPAAAPQKTAEASAQGALSTATASGMQRRVVSKGEVIFEEGSKGDVAYLIAEGEVEIYRANGGGEKVLARLGKGEIVGEMSLIDDTPRVASARALGDCRLVAIARDDLRGRLDWLDKNDRVLRRLIDVFVSRLRQDVAGSD